LVALLALEANEPQKALTIRQTATLNLQRSYLRTAPGTLFRVSRRYFTGSSHEAVANG
jgi:hypothetical protein